MRTPKIIVHDWTEDGPLYTIQHRIAGRRHRSALRRGEDVPDGITHYGNGDAASSSAPDSALIYAHGELDVFAFNAGHVYEVEMLVDGNNVAVLIDARQGIVVQEFGEGLEPLERRALTEDEVAEVEDGNPRQQPTNFSDGAESQAPIEVTVEATAPDPEAIAAVVEDHLGDQSLLTPEALEVLDPAGDPVDPEAPATPAPEDTDEPTSESDYGGTVADFVENAGDIDEDALVSFALNDSRKGIRDAAEREIDRRTTSGAAVGGDSAPEGE